MTFLKLAFPILILFTAASVPLQAEETRLEGVIQDQVNQAKSLAVINGNLYKTGEMVGTSQVKEIGSNYVKLIDPKTGQETMLQVKEAAKSTAPAPATTASAQASFLDTAKKYLANPALAAGRLSELQALRDISLINNASVKYFEKNGFFPVRLRQLTLDGFLPVSYESGKTDKYQFYLSNTPQKPDDFQLHADPLNPEAGLRYFFIGPDAVIRESTSKPADIKSPLHQYFKKK